MSTQDATDSIARATTAERIQPTGAPMTRRAVAARSSSMPTVKTRPNRPTRRPETTCMAATLPDRTADHQHAPPARPARPSRSRRPAPHGRGTGGSDVRGAA
ncbi:Uncharacterised protein [Mycobacteroides abscessus]|nr:Uncharacterised protein [Mycobacteroides abscessus]